MARIGYFTPLVLALWLSTMNAMAGKPEKPEQKDITPIQGIMVPEKEYPAVVQQALAGAGEPAFRLAVQHDLTGRTNEAIFWGTIAAENGHQGAMFNLGYLLSKSPDPKQRQRARFWLKKVTLSNDKTLRTYAWDVLSKLDEDERTNKANTAPRYGDYPKWPTE